MKREHILANIQWSMGSLPRMRGKQVDVQVVERVRLRELVRNELTFVFGQAAG